MRLTSLALSLLASCSALQRSSPSTLVEETKFTLLPGERGLVDSSQYGPLVGQRSFGAMLVVGRQGLGWELGIIASSVDEWAGVLDAIGEVEMKTHEQFTGARYTFGGEALMPYVGAGLSYLQVDIDGTVNGFSADASDESLGFYVHAGVETWVAESVAFGIEGRAVLGTDLGIHGSTDADFGMVSLTISYSF